MALNPSCNSVVEGTPLQVLGDPPFSKEAVEVAKGELRGAIEPGDLKFDDEPKSTYKVFKKGTRGDTMGRMGITAPYDGMENDTETAELVHVVAHAHGWRFRRAWYYWMCSSEDRPLSKAVAKEMNRQWGGQIRVNGYSGGTDVREPVSSYHVDTLEGLKKLVETIKATEASDG